MLPDRDDVATAGEAVDAMTAMIARLEAHSYGESVDMLDHALQTAAHAVRAGAHAALVAAALLHDVGHLVPGSGRRGNDDHAAAAATMLRGWLPESVIAPIRLHVDAKRWLVTSEPGYAARLSPASMASLRRQGGPMDASGAAAFRAEPHAADAVALRRWDDAGKSIDTDPPSLEAYRTLLLEHLWLD